MTNEYFISIIIPVFNAEKFLPDCLNIILERQDFKEFEVILVNDGSTDNSLEICNEYAEKDNRIKVIDKKNGGASAARNTGIKNASGKYILFVDSDDFIAEYSIEKIVSSIRAEGESDVVFLNSVAVFPDGSVNPYDRYKKELFFNQTHKDVLNNIGYQLPDFVWGKLIRRDVIVKNSIYFTEGIICEDVDFIIKLIICAETFNTFDFDYYYYRTNREGSVMNSNSNKLFIDLLYIIEKWTNLAETKYKEHNKTIYRWLSFYYCWILLARYCVLPDEIKRKNKKKVNELKWLLKYIKNKDIKNKRVILLKLCYKFFGLSFTTKILILYYKTIKSI